MGSSTNEITQVSLLVSNSDKGHSERFRILHKALSGFKCSV